MDKFYYYIDYGSGYVNITPQNNSIKLGIRRELNDFIQRKYLEGSFSLIGSEAQAAEAYYITAGSYEAPIRIYENGVSGVGTLQYEGWARVNGVYDFRREMITFNSFRTNDQYTSILPYLSDKLTGHDISGSSVSYYITIQGNSINCNELQAYTWTGTTYSTTGNPLSLADIGRLAIDTLGSGIVVYDNATRQLRRYVYSAPNWSLSATGTNYDMPSGSGNGALAAYTANRVAFIDDRFCQLSFFQMITGTYSLLYQKTIENLSLPSLAYVGGSNTIAIADNGTKVLRTYQDTGRQIGQTLSLGDVYKPQICALDSANYRIAMVDSKTATLRCYAWAANAWTQLGDNVIIPYGYEINLTQTATNIVTVIDAISGYMERYTFSGTAWTKTGTTASISNGYMAACGYEGTVHGVIQSDSYSLITTGANEYREMLNQFFVRKSILISMNATGTGSTFDYDNVWLANLADFEELSNKDNTTDKLKYSLEQLLKLPELFQNYWYLASGYIKFIQPNLFSSIGTDITVPSDIATELNQRLYDDKFLISKEDIIFKNELNSEFEGYPIDYGRNNPALIESALNITTDLQYFIDNIMGVESNFEKSGIVMMYGITTSYGANLFSYVVSGTGVISSASTKNNNMSKSKIQDDFWKDYRYANTGNITINNSSSAVQNTVRDMIQFPDFEFELSDVSLTTFPTTIASLNWGGGVKSYVTNLEIDLQSWKCTAKSRLLDI